MVEIGSQKKCAALPECITPNLGPLLIPGHNSNTVALTDSAIRQGFEASAPKAPSNFLQPLQLSLRRWLRNILTEHRASPSSFFGRPRQIFKHGCPDQSRPMAAWSRADGYLRSAKFFGCYHFGRRSGLSKRFASFRGTQFDLELLALTAIFCWRSKKCCRRLRFFS